MAKFYYGGQAVIEGVMMRGQRSVAVGIRRPDDTIYVYEEGLSKRLYQNRMLRLPFVRGILLLWDVLVLGTRMMTLAANIASGAVDTVVGSVGSDTLSGHPVWGTGNEGISRSRGGGAHPADADTGSRSSAELDPSLSMNDAAADDAPAAPQRIGGAALAISLVISLSFAIAIFFLFPLLITSSLRNQVGTGWLNLALEGVIRLALLVGYLYVIGRVPGIQRVFGYHGAEHKAINTMEHGDPLDVPQVRRASRVHTRCGTGFLLIVMVVSIFVFALVGSPPLLIKVISRIVLIPVVAGIAYELMRLGAANYRFRIVRWLLAPGLALQGLTTREPDDSMIECAIAALQRVLARDGVVGSRFIEEPDSLSGHPVRGTGNEGISRPVVENADVSADIQPPGAEAMA